MEVFLPFEIKEHVVGLEVFLVEVLEVVLIPLIQFQELRDMLHLVCSQELHQVLEVLVAVQEHGVFRDHDLEHFQ